MNITAFLNLMVVLVPFLLITAVFSRVTVLELNLPAKGGAGADAKRELNLEVTISADALLVGDRNGGLIKRIEKGPKGHDWKALNQTLIAVKQRFPDKLNATILSEANTSYNTLVQAMDAVRVAEVMQTGSLTQIELFPDISIGDAGAPEHGVAVRRGRS